MADDAQVASALRALRDCGPIMACFHLPGYAELVGEGKATVYIKSLNALIYRLTPAGEEAAKSLP